MRMIDEAEAGELLYPKFIRQIQRAPAEACSFSDHSQRATVLGELSKRGVSGARDALDALFLENLRAPDREFVGAFDIIDVDGERGLLQVCSALGRESLARPAFDIEHWFTDVYDEDHGEGAAVRALTAHRDSDPGIDHFLSLMEARQAAMQPDSTGENAQTTWTDGVLRKSAGEVIDQIRKHSQKADWDPRGATERMWLRRWGIRASETDLEQILRALEESDSPVEQCLLLSAFNHRRPMPRISDPIVALAESHDEQVRFCAYWALANNSDPRIRAAGLRSLSPELIQNGSLKLLQSSYRLGDHRALEGALYLPGNVEELHTIVYDLASICVSARDPECLPLMLFVYEYSPSGNCRDRVVESMLKLGIAPEWLQEEWRFDAMEDVDRL